MKHQCSPGGFAGTQNVCCVRRGWVMGELLALSALLLFSTNILLTQVASARVNTNVGFSVSVSVNVLLSLFLVGVQFFILSATVTWNSYGFLLFLIAGVFSTYLGRWLFYDSIAKLGSAKASTFQASNPLFTAIIAWIFLGEGLDVSGILALTLAVLGLFLVSYVPGVFSTKEVLHYVTGSWQGSRISGEGARSERPLGALLRSGVLLGILSAGSYALGNILRGAAIQAWNEPVVGAFIGATLGLVLHVLTSGSASGLWHRVCKADPIGLWLYAATGVLTITAQIFVIASMWYIPISITALITMSTPLVVTPLSYLLLNEQEGRSLRTWAGIALVLCGISLVLLG